MNNYLLIGAPNVGKTTVFNHLTKLNESVANYAGVTIDSKVGKLFNRDGQIIDLPGIYSILPSSNDEGVTSKIIINEDYNGIINIANISSLKRHLHLTLQLIELGKPLALILNFSDEFENAKRTLNIDYLKENLGIEVIKTTATKKIDVDNIINSVDKNTRNKIKVDYGILEPYIDEILQYIPHNKLRRRFLAINFLEGNLEVTEYLKSFPNFDKIVKIKEKCELDINPKYKNVHVALFDIRNQFINELLAKAEYSPLKSENIQQMKMSNVDKFLTSRVSGTITFISLLLMVYFLTFNLLGNPITDKLDYLFFETLQTKLESGLDYVGITGISYSLLVNGVYSGIFTLIVFLPQVVILFLFLTLLESVGYLSRVSILFDNLFSKFGLNGKSIIPLVTGVGCNVPAIMGARVIESKKERLITILIVPFISCNARIPVYLVFSEIFFEKYAFLAIFAFMVLGAVIAIGVAGILNLSLFKKEDSFLALEIPPFRKPQLMYTIKVTYNKGKSFLLNVTKYVAIGTIIVWALTNFGFKGYVENNGEVSFLESFSSVIAPFFAPLGFGDWQAVSSLISGFMAKELVISSMAVIYGVGESNISSALSDNFTAASALSFMTFNALYIPCIATVGVIKKETNSWKWTMFSMLLSIVVAYIISIIVYGISLMVL